MLEYRPLCETRVQHLFDVYARGGIPVLDIETSAKCLHNTCVYCDSNVGDADEGELSLTETIAVLEEGIQLGTEWVTICGLGEPLDDPKLPGILRYCRDNGLGVSIFTNLLYLTDEHIRLFQEIDIGLIVKCDSLNAASFDKTLGRRGTAQRIYTNLDKLLCAGFGGTECTSLALSIVPTRFTIDDIPEVVKFCKSRGLFPSIGEVEYSGKARLRYASLAVTRQELLDLKAEVERILGYPYCRQICPATIASLHITHVGECVVHRGTGVSCPWFLLGEPDMVSVGNVRADRLDVLAQRVRDYRRAHPLTTVPEVDPRVSNVFGGCGGKPEEILAVYAKMSYG